MGSVFTVNDTKGVVYRLNCASCDVFYIGSTKRSLGVRISEHRRDVCHPGNINFLNFSAIANHVVVANNVLSDDGVIICKERNEGILRAKESLFIESNAGALANFDSVASPLSRSWLSLSSIFSLLFF